MKPPSNFIMMAFVVGAVSDLVLRALDFDRFRPYFASRGLVEAAVIGGLIVLVVVVLAALFVRPSNRKGYLVAVTISSFFTAWVHDCTEPFGPELRAHSDLADSRLLDTLVGPFVALVVYAAQDIRQGVYSGA